MTLGALLSSLRERCGLSQAQTARQLDWSRNKIWQYEHDRVVPPSAELARLLQVIDPDRSSWDLALELAGNLDPVAAA